MRLPAGWNLHRLIKLIEQSPHTQFTMGTRANQDLDAADPEVINEYLGSSFKHMADYGEKVYRPFMQVPYLPE